MVRQIIQLRHYSTRSDSFNSIITKCTIAGQHGGGSLTNTTYALKDNIVTKDFPTTAASHALYNYQSPFDATVVKLLSANGATCIGKANLDEFGMGSSNLNSYYGAVVNPFNKEAVPGGSSGGSAAAVAGKIASFSIGTDTGGSIRLPASYCNVLGFKPTYGRISRWGVIPYAQTLDTVGILSEDIDLVEKVYDVLNVEDAKDPTSLPESVRDNMETTQQLSQLTFGIPSNFLFEEVSHQVRSKWVEVLEGLIDLGHKVKFISTKAIIKALPVYYAIATSEAASNLARYDGTRYGYTSRPLNVNDEPMDLIFKNRTESLGPEVQRRILLGNYTLSSESGHHYAHATQLREKLTRQLSSAFKMKHPLLQDQYNEDGCDLMISPTAIDVAPTVKESTTKNAENLLHEYINDIFTVPVSLAGLPAVSVPFNGIGIQVAGQYGDDKLVLHAAKIIK
ncbi:HER2 [Candida margitis]|uniref:HER2 n=1 Tax=Candida margitis TaxID=1775924 RepID=UPI002227D6D6|nr:HER2 [Candida margitis]KAI5968976.1 HER2 [Candida margitis]